MFWALNTNMLRFCVILVFIHGIFPLEIENVNVPYQVEEGDSAKLTCTITFNEEDATTDIYVKWWRITGQYARELLYQRIVGKEPTILKHSFKNITSTEENSITISELHPEHSGTFQCEVFSTRDYEDRKSGNLNVFTKGSGPVLNVRKLEQNSTSDDDNEEAPLLVECQVSGVAPKPDVDIKSNVRTDILNTTQSIEGPKNGRYNMSKQLTLNLLDDAEEAEFICELFYEDVNITHPAYIETIKTYKSSGEMVTEPEQVTQADTATGEPVDEPAGDSSHPLDKSTLLMIFFSILTIGNTYLCWQP